VKEQIRLAAGLPLSFTQDSVRFQGHSLECRVNAEEPDNFQPVSGFVTDLHIPGGPGVRVDTALLANSKIPPYYDSLIAKVIVHGMDRADAISKMKRALNEFHIDGTKTIIPFHLRLLDHPDFLSGRYSTHFVDGLMGLPAD
jgi:acetyl-CoA carboxylase biotin carboxylase subunit